MRRALFVLGGACALAAGCAGAQEVTRGVFLKNHAAGSIAMVFDNTEDMRYVKKLRPMTDAEVVEVKRRPRCVVAIAHHDVDRQGEETFAGVQIIKFFASHGSPGVVYAARGAGWLSAGKLELPEIRPTELLHISLADFVAAHSAEPPPAVAQLFTPPQGWHAYATADAQSYSGAEAHRRFWAKNPLALEPVKSALSEAIKDAQDIRVENRLYKFTLTGGLSGDHMPSFGFSCGDPGLKAAAIRIYRPFSTEPEAVGFVSFR